MMFYIWHTLIGYKLGKSKSNKEEVKRKCPMGFN
jgi:hypothetical protein